MTPPAQRLHANKLFKICGKKKIIKEPEGICSSLPPWEDG
jgi:hypothetical protein